MQICYTKRFDYFGSEFVRLPAFSYTCYIFKFSSSYSTSISAIIYSNFHYIFKISIIYSTFPLYIQIFFKLPFVPPLIDFVCNDSALPFGPLLLWFAIKSSSAEKLCPANFVICSCWGHRVFPQMVHSTRLLITPTLSNPSFEQHPVLKNSTVGLHCLFFTVLLASTQKSSGNWTSACPPGTRRQMEDLHDDFSVHFPLPATCPLWPLATFLEQSKTPF